MGNELASDIVFYSSPTGQVHIEVIYQDETFWLSQKRMAELFGVEVPAISKHLKNIFESNELQENSVVSKMETTEKQIVIKMEEWILFLHKFLELSNYPILEDSGKVSALEAKLKAEQEYEIYRQTQDEAYISDFDKEIKRLEGKN